MKVGAFMLRFRRMSSLPVHEPTPAASPRRAGFAVEGRGRVVSLDLPGQPPVATVHLDSERIAIEVRARSLSAASASVLRQWLLTMPDDGRSVRLADIDRSRVTHPRSAADALACLDTLLLGVSVSPSHLAGHRPMVAGPRGIVPLDDQVRARLGMAEESEVEAAIRLVRSSGCIVFLPDAGRLTVLAPAGASAEALTHASAWLSAQGTGAIRLRVWLGHGWVNEMAASGPAGSERLCRLTRLDRLSSPLPGYQGRRIRAEDMSADEIRFFAPLLSLSGSTFGSRAFTTLLRSGFGDRLFLTGVREGQGRHIIYAPSFDYVGSLWRHQAPGRRVLDQPDRAYGHHVNDRMVAAAEGGEPHVEHVQAGIRESDDDLQLRDTRLTKYLRVAVPFRCGGESLVVSYSLLRRWDSGAPVTA